MTSFTLWPYPATYWALRDPEKSHYPALQCLWENIYFLPSLLFPSLPHSETNSTHEGCQCGIKSPKTCFLILPALGVIFEHITFEQTQHSDDSKWGNKKSIWCEFRPKLSFLSMQVKSDPLHQSLTSSSPQDVSPNGLPRSGLPLPSTGNVLPVHWGRATWEQVPIMT